MKTWFLLPVLCGLILSSAEAADIAGTVREAAGDGAKIAVAADLVPSIGDKVEIYFKIPGGEDEVGVGKGSVTEVRAEIVTVKIESTAGTIARGQLARFASANPQKKTAAEPPPIPPVVTTTDTLQPKPEPPPGDHVAQGLALFNAGDMDGAIAHYNEAIRLLPASGIPYFGRASAYLRKNNFDGAIADADKALTLGLPNPADAFVIRGTARVNKGDVDGAIADCDRAIKIDPKHALAYNNRSNDRMLKRDWKGALADSNKAVSLDPNLALAYYNRGFARANTNDHNGAIADWNKAIQIQPSFQEELGRQIEISRSKLGRR